MKFKKLANKLNTFVVQKLKKIKINTKKNNEQNSANAMPAMPKEKSSILAENNYSELKMKENMMASVRKELSPNDTASPTTVTVNAKLDNNKSSAESIGNNRTSHKQQQQQQQNGTTTSSNTKSTSVGHTSDSKHKTCSTTTSGTTTTTTNVTTTDPTKTRSAHDYRFGKSIGEGSFSTVYLAKDIHTRKEYAIKVCEKQQILREKKQEYIKREREAMHMLSNVPGFVNLSCTFQDYKSLYFVMTYAKNGDLLPHLNKVGSFDLACSQHYAAELVLALENMHRRGIVHRDLKPENILFDDRMHTMIADFGSSKILPTNTSANNQQTPAVNADATDDQGHGRKRKNSFVGTAQYVSPEILNGQTTTCAADLWALGCIIYQMISGLPPFRAGTDYLIFQKVLKLELTFPDGFDPTAEDLVEKLLQIDPLDRLGATDAAGCYTSIRQHPFFAGVDWTTLRTQSPPPIHPYLPGVYSSEEEDVLGNQYRVPDHLETGLDDRQLTRLMGLELGTAMPESQLADAEDKPKNILDITEAERRQRLDAQKSDKWHQFVDGEVILKQGFVNKRKGLFARKRMLLLTTGPRLVYVDPVQMVKKGEIPWSSDLRVEPKNFKIFFVHTPNRTYYLEDAQGFALDWCQTIDEVRTETYQA